MVYTAFNVTSRALQVYIARVGWRLFAYRLGVFYELRVNEFRKLLLKHYHKLPLSHIEHDTKSHFNHPLPKHPKTDFFNNLMSYTSQALREGISNFCEIFEQFSEYISVVYNLRLKSPHEIAIKIKVKSGGQTSGSTSNET